MIATHHWMRPEPIRRTIERMAQTGVEGLEVAGELERFTSAEVRGLLKEHGRRCWGAVALALGDRNLASRHAAQREKTVDYIKQVVTFAKECGGEILTLVPATVGKLVADATPAEEWRWVVECVKEVHAHAEKEGIRIAIEPINRFETYLINRVDQALALADAVAPSCGVCLDIFHMNIEEADLLAAIRLAKGRIHDVHVADNNRFAPGQGMLDFSAIVRTIRDAGYTGALTLEFAATIDRTPANPWGAQVETEPSGATAEQLKFIVDHGSNLLSDTFYTGLYTQSVKVLRPLL